MKLASVMHSLVMLEIPHLFKPSTTSVSSYQKKHPALSPLLSFPFSLYPNREFLYSLLFKGQLL